MPSTHKSLPSEHAASCGFMAAGRRHLEEVGELRLFAREELFDVLPLARRLEARRAVLVNHGQRRRVRQVPQRLPGVRADMSGPRRGGCARGPGGGGGVGAISRLPGRACSRTKTSGRITVTSWSRPTRVRRLGRGRGGKKWGGGGTVASILYAAFIVRSSPLCMADMSRLSAWSSRCWARASLL